MQVVSKRELRIQYKMLRNEMSSEEKASSDGQIANRFLSSEIYKGNCIFYVYVSAEIEVDTRSIITQCFQDGKRVFAPRCISGTNIMNFYEIKSFDDLEKGAFGIMEPKKECIADLTDTSHCVCIVPGLAFDINGYRLGFGKGFYDRFLKNFKGSKIGLCYESCISDKLCRDEFDIPVNTIITDKKEIALT